MKKPNIFNYSDFRKFLNDLYGYMHFKNSLFTKAEICRRLGLPNSRSYFQDIINGKYLSQIKTSKIIEIFKLSDIESRFFRIMVNFNQAFDKPDERDMYFEQLISFNKTEIKEIDKAKYDYYSKWFYPAIKSILGIVDVRDENDYIEIKKMLIGNLTKKEISDSLKKLKRLDLIKKDENGYLRPTDKFLETSRNTSNELVKSFQIELLGQAQKAIINESITSKRTITKALTFSDEGLIKVQDALNRFSNEINSIIEHDHKKPDHLYQMILTLFPYTKGVE